MLAIVAKHIRHQTQQRLFTMPSNEFVCSRFGVAIRSERKKRRPTNHPSKMFVRG